MVLAPRPWRLSRSACAGRATGAKEAVPRGEHEISRQTIARGRSGCPGCTCQTRVRSYYPICTRCCGCRRRPAFPAPSFQRGSNEMQSSGENRAVRTRAHAPPRVQLSSRTSEQSERRSGTYNHRTWFCEGWSSNSFQQLHPVVMGPGVRRDDICWSPLHCPICASRGDTWIVSPRLQ